MNRAKRLHILGNIEGLGLNLALKAIHSGMAISVPADSCAHLMEHHGLEIEHLASDIYEFQSSDLDEIDVVVFITNDIEVAKGELSTLNPPCTSIMLTYSEYHTGDYLAEPSSLIVIHDMIPSTQSTYYDSNILEEMMSAIIEGEDLNSNMLEELRWWVSEGDVVAGMCRLLLHPESLPPVIHLCGRREWSLGDTYQQLRLLYSRTVAGSSGDFELQHLRPNSVISQGAIPVSQVRESSRPDLSALHGALLDSDGEGWRPLTPLRTSLMQYLASRLD